MENRSEERNELVARGKYALEHPDKVEPRGDLHRYRLFLRLWRYPSFESWVSWAVFEPGRYADDADDADSLYVRQIIWDQRHDLGRFADPLEWLRRGYRAPPTLDVTDATVSRETLQPHLDKLAHARIPLLRRDSSIVLDGEQCGVETYGFAVATRAVWRPGEARRTPPALLTLERLMDMLATLFEQVEGGRITHES